jgi:hypothetical protein
LLLVFNNLFYPVMNNEGPDQSTNNISKACEIFFINLNDFFIIHKLSALIILLKQLSFPFYLLWDIG